jgi:hypothetical protein
MKFHHPFAKLSQLPVGLRLMSNGCMPILPHRMKDHGSFRKIVKKALELEEGARR